jgi:seryl-tRNA synthetase
MLDYKFIRDHKEEVKANVRNRFMDVDVEEVVRLYEERNRLLAELEQVRGARNENAKKMKGPMPDDQRSELIEEGKRLKEQSARLEKELESTGAALEREAAKVPNMAHPEAPVGKEEKDNLELHRSGEPVHFSFPAKDHTQLGAELDLIDFDTASDVSGPKFYYLKNEAVFLELALVRYAMDILQRHGYTPTITPDIAKEEVVEGIGFNPRGAESNIYNLEETGTSLIGTAEITLGGYHRGKLMKSEELPIRLAGLSHCFRREAGAAGQFSKGLYRVHQFTKVEMFVYCRPEESEQLHQELLGIEEEIFRSLEIPYRVVDTCTGDLGAPAYRKFDLEAWMPGRGESGDWGEITSTSNCTDYQARRLKVRYKEEGKSRPVHMLNGTAVAVSRALVALLENGQREDGSVKIPEALVPYTGFTEIPAGGGKHGRDR